MNNIKVSVIVPIYNTAPWLKSCLDSICHQTLENIEIICINDGSTDNSLEILKEYQQGDSRIQIVDQNNKGLSEARNAGIKVAEGSYLFFMDSDDYLDLDSLEILSADMDNRSLDFLLFNVTSFGDDDSYTEMADNWNKGYFNRKLDENSVYSGVDLFCIQKRSRSYICTAWSSMISRSFFLEKKLWFHPGILHEDEPYTFSAMMSASRCGCLNRVLYHHRYRVSSIMTNTVSFENVYGYFVGILDMQKTINNISHAEIDLIIDHVQSFAKTAVTKYRNCDMTEKAKYHLLPPAEQIHFINIVVYPADLLDISDNKSKELRKIKKSRSYRLGRILTYIPRKCFSFFKYYFSSSNETHNK